MLCSGPIHGYRYERQWCDRTLLLITLAWILFLVLDDPIVIDPPHLQQYLRRLRPSLNWLKSCMTFSKYALLSIILPFIYYGSKGIIELSRYLTLDWWFTIRFSRRWISEADDGWRSASPATFTSANRGLDDCFLLYIVSKFIRLKKFVTKVQPFQQWFTARFTEYLP